MKYSKPFAGDVSTIGTLRCGDTSYKIIVHANAVSAPQQEPHLHLLADAFDVEVSLIDILVRDVWRIRWRRLEPRKPLQQAFRDYMLAGRLNFLRPRCFDRLHYAIWQWGQEYDVERTRRGINVLRRYLAQNALTPLQKYEKYLADLNDLSPNF